MDIRHNNNALKELNNCIGGLLHLGLNVITSRTLLHIGPNVITFRTLLHLGPNVITFRTLLHLGQLLHLGLQHKGTPKHNRYLGTQVLHSRTSKNTRDYNP